MEKLISLFFLIFVLALLFYVMWAISRGYPLNWHFSIRKRVVAITLWVIRGLRLDLRGSPQSAKSAC